MERKTRILIVDDEFDTLNLLRTMLDLSGYDTFSTLHSIEALSLAQANAPDVILLDIMMPQLDGFMLCKMMRLHPSTAKVPIVFITAYSGGDLEERRVDSGGDLVVPKPISIQRLIEAIDTAQTLRKTGTVATLIAGTAPPPPLVLPKTAPLNPEKVSAPVLDAPLLTPRPTPELAKTAPLDPAKVGDKTPAPVADEKPTVALPKTSPLNPDKAKLPVQDNKPTSI